MRRTFAASIATCAIALVVAGVAAARLQPVVKTAHNATLKSTILVTTRGMTLYDLSVERHGRFICTSKACLSFWTPLVLKKGATPGGARSLGLVKRPDGRLQVTYKGAPLYTFAQDAKPGDIRGNGFKDVGVWRPATVGAATTKAPAPAPGYGYGK